MKHKWHKEIKAWADGAEIEYRGKDGEWFDVIDVPLWDYFEYRIKPQPKEPQYLYAYSNGVEVRFSIDKHDSEWKYLGKTKLEQDE